LHDLAVIVRGKSVYAAGAQLPLADPGDMPDPTLGSRHRAAVGLSRECDAVVVIVSEETGAIRLAERGRLSSPMSDETLREELKARLGKALPAVARGRRAEDQAEAVAPRAADAGDSIAGMGSTGMHDSIAFKEGPREHV
jgi:diadenylate cyclase